MVQKWGSASGMSTALQLHGVAKLAPVGGDHVGGGGQAGGAAEFGHDLSAGEALLGAAGIFGIGEDVAAVRSRGGWLRRVTRLRWGRA